MDSAETLSFFWAMKWFFILYTSDFSSLWQIQLIIFWVFTFCFLLPVSGWFVNLLRSLNIFSLSPRWFFLTNKDFWKIMPRVFINGVVQKGSFASNNALQFRQRNHTCYLLFTEVAFSSDHVALNFCFVLNVLYRCCLFWVFVLHLACTKGSDTPRC